MFSARTPPPISLLAWNVQRRMPKSGKISKRRSVRDTVQQPMAKERGEAAATVFERSAAKKGKRRVVPTIDTTAAAASQGITSPFAELSEDDGRVLDEASEQQLLEVDRLAFTVQGMSDCWHEISDKDMHGFVTRIVDSINRLLAFRGMSPLRCELPAESSAILEVIGEEASAYHAGLVERARTRGTPIPPKRWRYFRCAVCGRMNHELKRAKRHAVTHAKPSFDYARMA